MGTKGTITHQGIVTEVRKDGCTVRILQATACSACSARQLCRSAESKEKVMDIAGHHPTLKAGDAVVLSGSVRQGLDATMLAYGLPLVLMVVALFAGTRCWGEGAGALSALACLALYYIVLYLLRHTIGRRFAFEIVKAEAGDTQRETK